MFSFSLPGVFVGVGVSVCLGEWLFGAVLEVVFRGSSFGDRTSVTNYLHYPALLKLTADVQSSLDH